MVAELNANARAAEGFKHLASALLGREPKVETKAKSSPILDFFKKKAG